MASLHEISDSDSDRTVDPNEEDSDVTIDPNEEQNLSDSDDAKPGPSHPKHKTKTDTQKLKIQHSASFHEMSDSDEDEERKDSSRKRKREVSSESPKSPGKEGQNGKPVCKYGKTCFRKNASHLKNFSHPEEKDTEPEKKMKKVDTHGAGSSSIELSVQERLDICGPTRFLFTHVTGISDEYNATRGVHIKEILACPVGDLIRSAQFNYKIDIPWLVAQYPYKFRTKPLLVVHGEQRESKHALQAEAEPFTHIRLCQARLEIMFGTHHTKMMFLQYDTGLRIVIHTANLIDRDWYQKTQGVWISPVFPKLSSPSATAGDSHTHFKKDMIEYLTHYRNTQLTDWISVMKEYDMSQANVFLIGSVPGRHTSDKKSCFGHMKLRKILSQHGPSPTQVQGWPLIGQFSSVGSMGANRDNWLCAEWLSSLSTTKGMASAKSSKLKLVYPTKENVRLSLEGYLAGGSLPYSINVAKKQPFLHEYFHQWKSDYHGRSQASPHIKTYMRASPDYKQLTWFLCTSANLSKAAWGALEKQGSQLMIRSYELGVLLIPSKVKSGTEVLNVEGNGAGGGNVGVNVPFDLPLTPYGSKDRPWIWDIPYVDKPDTHGTKWCPS